MLGYAGPMTVTLCIDTSTSHCSVALAVGDEVFADTQRLERRHNQQVIPMLDALYQRAGVAIQRTELVSFSAGPGGFTGVRIAASVTQGIAMACNCSVVPQRCSDILVRSWAQCPVAVESIVCAVPSRAQSFYLSAHTGGPGRWSQQYPDQLCDHAPEWLSDIAQRHDPSSSELALIGAVPDWLVDDLQARSYGEVVPDARVMIGEARTAHAEGRSVAPELALPIYVQGDSPWRKRQGAEISAR